jgi:hypothetical protein
MNKEYITPGLGACKFPDSIFGLEICCVSCGANFAEKSTLKIQN